jgi:hypothetical protein
MGERSVPIAAGRVALIAPGQTTEWLDETDYIMLVTHDAACRVG